MASWLGRFTPRKPKAIAGGDSSTRSASTPRAIAAGAGDASSSSSSAAGPPYDPVRVPFAALTGTHAHLPPVRAGRVVLVRLGKGLGSEDERMDQGEGEDDAEHKADEQQGEDEGAPGDLDTEHASSAFHHPSTSLLLRLLNHNRVLEVRSLRLPARPGAGAGAPDVLRLVFPARLLDLARGSAQGPLHVDPATGDVVLVLVSATEVYRVHLPGLLARGDEGGGEGGRALAIEDAARGMHSARKRLPSLITHDLGGARACDLLNERDVVVRCANGLVKGVWDAETSSWSFFHFANGTSLFWNKHRTLLGGATHLSPLGALAYGATSARGLRAWNALTGACVREVDLGAGAGGGGAEGDAHEGDVLVLAHGEGADGAEVGGHSVVVYLAGGPGGRGGSFSVVRATTDGGALLDLEREVVIPADVAARGGSLRGMAVRAVYAPAPAPAAVPSHNDADETMSADEGARADVVGHRLFALYTLDGGRALLQWTDLSAHSATRRAGEQQMVRIGAGPTAADDTPSASALRWRTIDPPGQDTAVFDATYFDGLMTADTTADDVSSVFLAHVFHPGRFSEHTIEASLDDYAAALADDLDFDPRAADSPDLPAALDPAAHFPHLRARVAGTIGCALETPTDPRTGAVAVDALARLARDEWMAFWVRLLASDRQARFAVALAEVDPDADTASSEARRGESVMVLSREGVMAVRTMDPAELLLETTASLAQEEHALTEDWMDVTVPISAGYDELVAVRTAALSATFPALLGSSSIASLLGVVRIAREILGRIVDDMPALEQDLIDTLRRPAEQAPEEYGAGVYARYVQPIFEDAAFRTAVEEQLQQAGNAQRTMNHLLDIFHHPDANAASDPELATQTAVALVISAFTQSVQARHALALSLLVLALHLGSTVAEEDDESPAATAAADLVARTLVTYHKCATLHWLSEQDGREAQEMAEQRAADGGDDLPFEFTRLRVNGASSDVSEAVDPATVYSALHCALDRPKDVAYSQMESLAGLAHAASRLNRQISSISDIGDVSAGMAEVFLARHLVESGQPTTALAFCDRFPAQAGFTYVAALSHISLGSIDQAVACFEQVGAALNDANWKEDSRTALGSILPSSVLAGSTTYNRHVMDVFDAASATEAMLAYAERAIAEAQRDDPSVEDLWRRIFKGRLDAEEFEAAYHSMISNPFANLTSDVPGKDRPLGNLINAMCQANEVQRLFSFSFIGYEDVLENELVFKARNSDPLAFPNYHQVLYAYYMQKKKFRDAGRAMYQQGQRLRDHTNMQADNFFEVAAFQAQCYLAAISAFSQVKPQNAWATVPAPSRDSLGMHDHKRRRIRSHIPMDQFSNYSKDVEIVTLSDVRRDYALILSTLKTISRLDVRRVTDAAPAAKDIIALQCEANLYDDAFATARDLEEDMTPVFAHLTEACLSFRDDEEGDMEHGESWLDTSQSTCAWHGPAKDKAWRYLQMQLSRHDHRADYTEAVAEAVFAKGRSLPPWLAEQCLQRNPESLIRHALRHGQVEQAARWGQDVLRKIPVQPSKVAEGGMQPSYTPIYVLEQVIRAGSGPEYGRNASSAATRLRDDLEKRIEAVRAIKL